MPQAMSLIRRYRENLRIRRELLRQVTELVFELPLSTLVRNTLKAERLPVVVFCIVWLFGRDWMLMTNTQIWQGSGGEPAQAQQIILLCCLAGIGLCLISGIRSHLDGAYRSEIPTGRLIGYGVVLSILAGVLEEIRYRWMMFLSSMVFIRLINVIVPYGWFKWLYTDLFVPVANWVTFGMLEPQLTGGLSWLLGAAVVSAAADFRRAHKLKGPVAKFITWYFGMVFFYLMFHHGLMTAIIAHILYDVTVFVMAALVNLCFPRQPYRHMRFTRY